MALLTEGVQNSNNSSNHGKVYEKATRTVDKLSIVSEGVQIFDRYKDIKESKSFGDEHIIDKKRLEKLLNSNDVNSQLRAATTLSVIENLKRKVDSDRSIGRFNESVYFANLGPMAPKVFDLVNIFYPNIIAHDICDIQPIASAVGTIYVVKPIYSNTAGGVNAGDQVFKTMSPTGSYASEINYATSSGDGTSTTFNFTLETPVVPGTVQITYQGIKGVDTGINGKTTATIVGQGVASGTIDYSTGAMTVTFSAAPANSIGITVQYNQSSEGNIAGSINQLEFVLDQIPVTARNHPLQYQYSVQSNLIASAQIGMNLSEMMAQECAFFIKKERDNRLLYLMKNAAVVQNTLNFDATPPTGFSLKDKYAALEIKLDEATNIIQLNNGKGTCNYVIVGTNAANILKQSTGFRSEAEVPQIGSYRIGTLRDGTIPVIKAAGDQGSIGPNDIIFGFKGYQFGDAGVILAEFLPLYSTPEFQSPDLYNKRGLVFMYDMFVNNNNYIVRGTISNYQA